MVYAILLLLVKTILCSAWPTTHALVINSKRCRKSFHNFTKRSYTPIITRSIWKAVVILPRRKKQLFRQWRSTELYKTSSQSQLEDLTHSTCDINSMLWLYILIIIKEIFLFDQMFTGTVKLAQIDDYINPGQNCIQPKIMKQDLQP